VLIAEEAWVRFLRAVRAGVRVWRRRRARTRTIVDAAGRQLADESVLHRGDGGGGGSLYGGAAGFGARWPLERSSADRPDGGGGAATTGCSHGETTVTAAAQGRGTSSRDFWADDTWGVRAAWRQGPFGVRVFGRTRQWCWRRRADLACSGSSRVDEEGGRGFGGGVARSLPV
jgi:hypothetical protein